MLCFFQVAAIFGLHGRPFSLWSAGVKLEASTDLSKLDGKTITVGPKEGSVPEAAAVDGSVCR